MIVYTSKGEELIIEDKAVVGGAGGEGQIHKIISPSHMVGNCVKIYYVQKRSQQQADKIRFMVDNPPKIVENHGFKIGWPLDVVLQSNKFIGFMMPLAFPDSKKLVTLTTPTLSKKLDSVWQGKYDRNLGKYSLISRLKLMNNIAIPVHLLHATGKYVLQDFKPDNVLITHSGKVTICDMDSIQITNGQNMLFRGTAATAGYAPPEFENNGIGKSPTVPLNKSWDNFALSVVFYQLLFGLHPYAVTPKMQKDANSSEISTNISDDLFPFGSNALKIQVVPPLHNKFNILPPKIQDLFHRSFSTVPNQRPGAEEWGKNIHEIIASAGTVTQPPLPIPSKPQPKPAPAPQHPLKIPTETGTSGSNGRRNKGCVSLFVILTIISISWAIAANWRGDNNNFINSHDTQTYQSGDNGVVVAIPTEEYAVAVVEKYETPAEKEQVIYSDYFGDDYVVCNGIHPYSADSANARYFSVDLERELNRNHFKISFQFWVTEHRSQWALMLSNGYRVFGVNVDNGQIYISTNNQSKYYDTNNTYQLNQWNYMSVEYYYGRVSVNGGDWFNVEMNINGGDNVLSSINYSSGNAFNGYLSGIEVASYR